MLDYKNKTELLIKELKIMYPKFEIKFKNEDRYMIMLGKFVSIFNKKFMSDYTTVLGYTVYFPSREFMERNWKTTFYILSHESIHMSNQAKGPAKYILGYSFPQNLALLSLFSFLAIINPAFLVFLFFLLALAPWPAPFRVKEETLGYGMNCKLYAWDGYKMDSSDLRRIADNVCGWPYYNPIYPYKNMIKELKNIIEKDDTLLPSGYLLVERIHQTIK